MPAVHQTAVLALVQSECQGRLSGLRWDRYIPQLGLALEVQECQPEVRFTRISPDRR